MVLEKLNELPDEVTIKVGVDDNATTIIESIIKSIHEIPNDITTTVHAEVEGMDDIKDLNHVMDDLEREYSTTVEVSVEGAEGVDELKHSIKEADGQEVNVEVNTEGIEEAEDRLSSITSAVSDMKSQVIGLLGAYMSYQGITSALNYGKLIDQTAVLTNATRGQRKELEKTIEANYNYTLGMKGGAEIMYTLASYTRDYTLTIGYYKAALTAVARSGEDASTVTLTLARVFRDFNITVAESEGLTHKLLELWRRSGFSSFTEFLGMVDRTGYYLDQAGVSADTTAKIIASLGPRGTRVIRQLGRELGNIGREWKEGSDVVEEYGKKLEKLGISVRDSSGNLKSFNEVLEEFLTYLSTIPDDAERARVATEIFGEKAGPALAEVADKWDELGDVSEENAKKTNKALGESAAAHRDILTEIKGNLDKFIDDINTFLEGTGYVGQMVASILFFSIVKDIYDLVKKALKIVIKKIWDVLKDSLKNVSRERLTGFAESVKDALKNALDDAITRLKTDDFVQKFLNKMEDSLREVARKLWDRLKNLLRDEGGRAFDRLDVDGVITRLGTNLDDAASSILPRFGTSIGRTLVKAVGEGVGVALQTADILYNFKEYLRDILEDPFKFVSPVAEYSYPEWLRRIFSPETIFKAIMGPEEWEKAKNILLENARVYIQEPFRREVENFFKDPARYLKEGFSQMWSDFKAWVYSHIPSFEWPSLPPIKVPDIVGVMRSKWEEFKVWVYSHIPSFEWPSLPSIKVPDIVGGIRSKWEQFKAWVYSRIPSFKWPSLPSIKVPDIVGGIRSKWEQFKAWVRSAFKSFRWPNLPNIKLPDFAGLMKSAWSKFKSAVSSSFKSFKWPSLPLPNFSGIASKFREWGSSFISNLAAGIRSAIPNLNRVLSIIRRLLPSSPPKEGPLSTLTYEIMHEYGYLLGTHFNRGLSATIPGTVESLGKPSLVIPSDVTAGRGSSMLMGGLNLQINTNVSVDKIESEVDVDDMARRITDKVKENMCDELNRQGILPYLYGRGYVRGVR
ncbi:MULTISPECIES: phage tail tape measure protein [Methanothermobacter]|uniref:Phage tail tape measure protein n=2 Tax=root TaxID=1 RepID=A0A9E7RU42_METWO|nr:phage tail tape measure protein [Methanothermobacter wolfeii]UXH31502.1 phage tail tape measure protein [Methanothermobacter wolfeii]